MGLLAYALIVVGYGLLYTGLMDFSGNNIGLFQALGYNGTAGPSISSAQYEYNNPTANMTSQPAVYSLGSGISGSVSV